MTPELKYAVRTDMGRIRKNNEDNFIEYISPDRSWMVLGAIDGVGGYEGGEIAAQLCKDYVESNIARLDKQILENPQAYLKEILTGANNAIWTERLQKTALSKMSCVASFALMDVRSQLLYFAHVGDTRGYLFRNGELIKFTHDHSVVGYLEDSGSILEQDALNHPRRNEILKMLGEKLLDVKDAEFIETGSHSFYAGDIVLFCSDGLTDLVNRASISETLGKTITLDEKVRELIAKANNLGGKDNITAAIAGYPASEQTAGNEPEENVMITSSKNNINSRKKSFKKFLFYFGIFLMGVLTMFLLDRFVFQKDTPAKPQFDTDISIDSLRTNPVTPDSLAADSLLNDSIANDSIIPLNHER